jgi:hypothetical protein
MFSLKLDSLPVVIELIMFGVWHFELERRQRNPTRLAGSRG